MTTEGSLLWTSNSLNRLLNSLQSPVMLGNLTLTVISAVVEGSTIRVTSNATISYFQFSSLLVECSETTTSKSENATFIPAGKC